MLASDKTYQENVLSNMYNVAARPLLPTPHVNYLVKLKTEYNFTPEVCYDIGSAVLHWTKPANTIWPDSKIFLFDAFAPAEELYKRYRGKYQYNIGVLSDVDNKIVRFYQNDFYFGGNSYYMEIGSPARVFSEEKYIEKTTRSLDSVVKERGFPLPDLVKIDVQGAEYDVIKGGIETISNATYLIVEMQNVHYNKDAPLVSETKPYIESLGWKCIAEKFSDNGPDADYCFVNLSKPSFFSEK